MTTAVLRAIREMRIVTAQDALDIVQCLAGRQCSFDTQCLDDCISILEECVSEETLTLEDFRQEPPEKQPRNEKGQFDVFTPKEVGGVPAWIFNSL